MNIKEKKRKVWIIINLHKALSQVSLKSTTKKIQSTLRHSPQVESKDISITYLLMYRYLVIATSKGFKTYNISLDFQIITEDRMQLLSPSLLFISRGSSQNGQNVFQASSILPSWP